MSKTTHARSWVRLVAVTGLAIFGAGCGPDTLETSSVEKLEESLAVLREQSELEQRDRLDEALEYLVGEDAIMTSEEGEEPSHPELILALYEPLKGMTAEGIIAEAMRIRLGEVQSTVKDLEMAKIGSDEARAELDRE